MKTPNRNFVVEYKGTRKRGTSQPKSIWGDIDLRSAAKSVEADGLLPSAPQTVQTAAVTEDGTRPTVGVEPASAALVIEEPVVTEATETSVAAEEVVQEQPSASSEVHAEDNPGDDEIAPPSRKTRGKDLKPRRRRVQVPTSTEAPPEPVRDASWEDELAQLDAENRRLKRALSEKLRGENEALAAMLQRLR